MATIVLTESVFRTRDLPVADRLPGFRACIAEAAFPVDVSSEPAERFEAEVQLLLMNGVSVYPSTLPPTRFVRTARLIRQADPELYHLTLPLHSTADVSHLDRRVLHDPYEMYVIDSSIPFDCMIAPPAEAGRGGDAHPQQGTVVNLDVCRSLVPLPRGRVERLLARPLPARHGMGALLAGLLVQMAAGGPYLPSDGPRLERAVVDLFTATLAHHLDAEDALAPETRTRTLTLRIRAFVERHLNDPELAPPAIAAAHHISLSYLHRLFRAEGTTVAAMIRRGRLERAHSDLSDPALAGIPIHSIAARWGFKSHADFTRSYRSTYGVSPREQRTRTIATVSALPVARQPAAA